jgi:hypothetical protein
LFSCRDRGSRSRASSNIHLSPGLSPYLLPFRFIEAELLTSF